MRWEGLGDFAVTAAGRRIVVYPEPGVPDFCLRDCLLSAVVSFALLERGVETLHAAAVARRGRAVAFLGHSQSGKSSLAAVFVRRGWELLTDDLLVLAHVRGRILAYPALPEIKLTPETARALALPTRRFPRVEPGNPKRVWQLPATHRPRLLSALYFPRFVNPARGRVRLSPLSPAPVFRALLRHTFNPTLTSRARLKRQFALFTRVARTVPARRLFIPRRLDRLEEIAKRIERDQGETLL